MSEKVKVMIADDHSMIREGLKQLLELGGEYGGKRCRIRRNRHGRRQRSC